MSDEQKYVPSPSYNGVSVHEDYLIENTKDVFSNDEQIKGLFSTTDAVKLGNIYDNLLAQIPSVDKNTATSNQKAVKKTQTDTLV